MRNQRYELVIRLLTVLTLLLGLAGPLAVPVAAASLTLNATTCVAPLGGSWNSTSNTCTVAGGPTVTDDWTVPAGTTLVLSAGGGIIVGGGTFTNQGTVTILGALAQQGGSVVNAGTMTIGTLGQAMPTINLWSFSFDFPMLYIQTGTFTNSASGVINNHVMIYNQGTLANSGAIHNRGMIENGGTLANSGTLTMYCGAWLQGSGTYTGSNPVTDNCILNATYCPVINGAWDGNSSTCTISDSGYATSGLTIPSGTTLRVSSTGTYSNMIVLLNEGTIVNEGGLALSATYNGVSSTFTNAAAGVVENYSQMSSAGSATNNGVIRNQCGGTFEGTISGNPVVEVCTFASACTSNMGGTWAADSNTCTVAANPILLRFNLTVPAGSTLRLLAGAALMNLGDLVNDGTITNEGSFAAATTIYGEPSTFVNNGVVNNLATMGQDGGTVTNAGVMNIGSAGAPAGMFMNQGGTFANSASGSVHVRGGILNQGTISNVGTVRVYCGGGIDNRAGTWTGTAAVTDSCVLDATMCTSIFAGTWVTATSTCTVSGTTRQVVVDLTIPAGVTLSIPVGVSVMNNANLTNAGTIVNRGGFFMALPWFQGITTSLTNQSGALIDNYGTMVNAGAVTNHGVVQNRCGAVYGNTWTQLPTAPFVPGVTLTGTWAGNEIANACNVAPVAENDAYSATEDTTLTVGPSGVLSNDTDAEGNPLTAIRVIGPARGTLALNADGSFTYVPTANLCGADSFTYQANDGTDDSNVATVSLAVACVDDPPVAVNDSYTTLESTPLTIANPGVLANDHDVDSSGLEATQMSSPGHGSLVLSNMGGFLYEPAANWCGTDSFTYRVSSITGANRIGNIATVTLNVTCVNDAPVAVADSYSTLEDRTLNESWPGVLGNDSDTDGDPLTAQWRSGPAHGTVTLNADGSFSYTPALNYYGPDSFTYRAYDGRLYSADTTVSITVTPVNDEPVAVDDHYTVLERNTLTVAAPGVLANDNDIEGSPLSAIKWDGPWRGDATLNLDGSFTYTPWAGTCGLDYFVYRARDTGMVESNFATVFVDVTCVNDAPVLASIGNRSVNELATLTFTASATDPDDGTTAPHTLTFSLVNPPAGATITGSTGVFTWTPTEAQGYGAYPVTVWVCDDGSPALCDNETITVTVNEVNSAPVLAAIGNKTVDEMVPLTFTAHATDPDTGTGAKNVLTYILVGAPTGASINTSTGAFTWTPTETQGPGSYTFTVQVCDNGSPALCAEETITVTVNEVNRAPVLNTVENKTIDEEMLLSFLATAYDLDVISGATTVLTFSLLGAPDGASMTTGGAFTWTPTEAQGAGVYTMTVQVCDNGMPVLCAEQPFTITVNEVNSAPVLDAIGDKSVDEMVALSFTATASDRDTGYGAANVLTFSIVGAPEGAAINGATGAFSWTPTEAQGAGVYTFTVRVCDNGVSPMCDTGSFAVTVNEVNREPVLETIGNQTVDEMTALTFSATAGDPDSGDGAADKLTFTLIDAPEGASMTSGGAFSWAPTEEQGYGTYTFIVKVCDDGDPQMCDSEEITVTVNEVNRAPILDPVGNKTVDEETLLRFLATGSDRDLGPTAAYTVTFSLAGAPSGASITPGGTFSWTPTEAQGAGVYTATVRVCDAAPSPLCDFEGITITVNEVNSAPVLDAIGDKIVDEMVPLNFDATASDRDSGNGAANVLTFALTGAPAGASINGATGAFTWTPTEEQGAGVYTFEVEVCDDGVPAMCDGKTITVTVNEVNRAPALGPVGNKTIDEEIELVFQAMATDPDTGTGAANILTFSLVDAPSGASMTAGGAFTWTPTEDQGAGEYTFAVQVCDNGKSAMCDDETITVTVNEVNLAPELDRISNATTAWGNKVSFLATGSDPDTGSGAANRLVFSATGTPEGASLYYRGAFEWTPRNDQIGTYTFTVQVCDNAAKPLCDSQEVTITVTKRATQLVYTGDTAAQYSDAATLRAVVTDDGGGTLQDSPIADLMVNFKLHAHTTGARTGPDGAAETSLVMTQLSGDYTMFTGLSENAYYVTSLVSNPFTILKESAEIIYTGDTQVVTAKAGAKATLTLAATVTEDQDGRLGTRLGEQTLRFDVFSYGDSAQVMSIASCEAPITGVTEGAGSASCSVSLGAGDPYQIRTLLVTNDYYTAGPDTSLAQVSDPGSGTSGGGWLIDPNDGSRVKFAFGVKFLKNGRLQGNSMAIYQWTGDLSQTVSGAPTGERAYNMIVKSNALSTMVLLSPEATGSGYLATVNGKCTLQAMDRETGILYSVAGGLLFQVDAAEKDKAAGPDGYALRVWDGSGVRYMTGDAYDAAGALRDPLPIGGGKVKVTIK